MDACHFAVLILIEIWKVDDGHDRFHYSGQTGHGGSPPRNISTIDDHESVRKVTMDLIRAMGFIAKAFQHAVIFSFGPPPQHFLPDRRRRTISQHRLHRGFVDMTTTIGALLALSFLISVLCLFTFTWAQMNGLMRAGPDAAEVIFAKGKVSLVVFEMKMAPVNGADSLRAREPMLRPRHRPASNGPTQEVTLLRHVFPRGSALLLATGLIAGMPAAARAAGDEAPFLAENDAAMSRMMADMTIRPSGDVDRDFVAMMEAHHQGAIDMAQAVLRHGSNEQIRRIAQEIVVEQLQEITAMRLAVGETLPPSVASPTQAPR
jgi:hypothetical protein